MNTDYGHWTNDPLLAFVKALETVRNPRGAAAALIEALIDEADYTAVWRVLGPTLTPWVGTPLPQTPEKLSLSDDGSPMSQCLSRGQALCAPLASEPLLFDLFRERPDCADWNLALVPVTVAGRHPALLVLAGENKALPARLLVYGQLAAQFGAYLARLAARGGQTAQAAPTDSTPQEAETPAAAIELAAETALESPPSPAHEANDTPPLEQTPQEEPPRPESPIQETPKTDPLPQDPPTPTQDWGGLYREARRKVEKNWH